LPRQGRSSSAARRCLQRHDGSDQPVIGAPDPAVGGVFVNSLPEADGIQQAPAIDRRNAIARFKAFITNYRSSDQRDKIDRPIYRYRAGPTRGKGPAPRRR
jgi:hypothetical protein